MITPTQIRAEIKNIVTQLRDKKITESDFKKTFEFLQTELKNINAESKGWGK